MNRVFNFSSGPSTLPIDILKQIKQELYNWNGLGVSIMEINHRDKKFINILEEAKQDLRDLLNIPLNYKILFCHGGGRGQFSALPLNLLGNKKKADYVNTGYWSNRATNESKKYCFPNIIDAQIIIDGKYSIKSMSEWEISKDSAYVHYCPNETIDGIAIYENPNFYDSTVVTADFSSIILSTPVDISRFGLIYASAQKNIGIAGLTLVIIRNDLFGKASKLCPSILNYTIMNENNSMFNTPTTFALYIAGMIFKWLKKNGGVKAMDIINHKKSELLYNLIDNSYLYINNIAKTNRSLTNIPFRLRNSNLNEIFLKESNSLGLYALQGHRSVGGMRASIYNAMPLSGVIALSDFMIDFERKYS